MTRTLPSAGVLAALLLGFLATTGSAAADLAVKSKFDLWRGATRLRGADIWVTRSYGGKEASVGSAAVGPAYTQADFDRLAGLGANYVNISHAGIFTETPPYKVDPDALARLDGLLRMAAKADLFAVITFRTGPGRSEFTFHHGDVGGWFEPADVVETVWTDPAAQDAWAEMWRTAALRYKDDPTVVGYDLMCEPNSHELLKGVEGPEDFYPAYAGTLYDWNRLYPRIVEAVRAVDKKTPILLEGPGYGGVDWLPFLKKSGAERVVYAVHDYEPQEAYSHQAPGAKHSYPGSFDATGDGNAVKVDRRWLDALLKPADDIAAGGSPVVVNEFGVHRWVPGGARYVRDQMELFERRGWSHALWAFSAAALAVDWTEADAIDHDSFDFTHGPVPARHAIVKDSGLLRVIRSDWAKNVVRPSRVEFSE